MSTKTARPQEFARQDRLFDLPPDPAVVEREWKRREKETARAIARGLEGADPAWREAAREAIYKTCVLRQEFCADDVWEVGNLPDTRDNRALGGLILEAARNGWCVRVPGKTVPTRNRRAHMSPSTVWSSRIYGRIPDVPPTDGPAGR